MSEKPVFTDEPWSRRLPTGRNHCYTISARNFRLCRIYHGISKFGLSGGAILLSSVVDHSVSRS